MRLDLLLWATGSLLLLASYGWLERDFRRAATLRRIERGETSDDGIPSASEFLRRASEIVRNQDDPRLESKRRRVLLSVVAFGLWASLGYALLHAILPVLAPEWMDPYLVLVATLWAGYCAYLLWLIIRAVRGGPQWRSGWPGDIVRWPRGITILWAIAGIIVAVIGLIELAKLW